MIKNSLNLFIAFLLTTTSLCAQTLSSSVLMTSGGSASTGQVQLGWSIGGSFLPTTLTGGSNQVLTQGFQQPELQVWTAFWKKTLYPGTSISVPFKASGIISSSNTYTLELSDKHGNFQNPVRIGTVQGNQNGTVMGIIPTYAVPGTEYRIRVTSSASPFRGTDNGEPLTLKSKVVFTAFPNPSTAYFNISSTEGFDESTEVRVLNQSGMLMETRKGVQVKARILQLGANYRPGVYFVEIVHGGERQVLRLEKLPD